MLPLPIPIFERDKSGVAPIVNLYPNSRFQGATVGVIGSGGVLPTGMTQSVPAGALWEVISVTSPGGIDKLTMRLNYNNTSGSTQFPGLFFNSAVPIVFNSPYVYQRRFQVVSGALAGSAVSSPIGEETSGGGFLNSLGNVVVDTTDRFYQVAYTSFNNVTLGRWRMSMSLTVPNLANIVDAVFDISNLMVETGAISHAYVATP